ncbi:MAG: leucine-rich repeat domain-containing protein [Lachnoclostridium sp.]|nr:leucine-rich repeat domain-containing protein [Lachnospira sp.]MCM1248865.1 leucine-rich repeat domain-containing protein [Lachnoclostridium sp.]
MKKKILAAFVCAATVLSLAGCAGSKNDRPMENTASVNTNTSPAPSTPEAGTSKPEASPTDEAGSTNTPEVNLADWDYRTYKTDSGENSLRIAYYKGTDEKVEIPAEINGVEVTLISGGAFRSNIDITSVTIPATIVEIDEEAFAGCLNLSEITFEGSAPILKDGSKNALNAFKGTPWLEAKKEENPDFFIIGDVLYKGLECEGNITIPDNVKKIADFAFYQNAKVTGATIPDSVTELGTNAFEYNIELVYKGTVYKGSGDYKTLRETIAQNAITAEFGDEDCIITDNVLMKVNPNVTKLELPDTVKDIDDKAFDGCSHSIVISFKGKNYNYASIEKLKADMSAE